MRRSASSWPSRPGGPVKVLASSHPPGRNALRTAARASEASADREQSGEGGDQGAIGPTHPRPWHASLEYGELVAQDQDLDVLGGVRSGVQRDPAQELGEHLVDQPQRHQRIMPRHLPRTTGQVRDCVLSFGHAQGRQAHRRRGGAGPAEKPGRDRSLDRARLLDEGHRQRRGVGQLRPHLRGPRGRGPDACPTQSINADVPAAPAPERP